MRRLMVGAAVAAILGGVITTSADAQAGEKTSLRGIDHIVVIYEENHSFDNLFGSWPGVNGFAANPADTANVTQNASDGVTPLACLPQNDVNLTSPPLPGTACTLPVLGTIQSNFANAPFNIGTYITPDATTCPPLAKAFAFPNGVLNGNGVGLPGGCTRDLVHKFYQEQFQIDGGKMDRYVAGSDAIGLSMGYYNTQSLPIYQYLTGEDAPNYAVLDNFFQSAFGGSFLNHQWLISAQTPVYPSPLPTGNTLHSIIGADGSPSNYPLHPSTGLRDGVLTVAPNPDGSCPAPARVCGDYAVNTMQPSQQPFGAFGAKLPLQTHTTIGDELSAKGISWAWYAGGWDNAAGNTTGKGWTNGPGPTCSDPNVITGSAYPNCPDWLFQFHHQPFNYYANYAQGTPGRTHLKDEVDFVRAAKRGKLPKVSFVKPIGEENEHPGYASQSNGNSHLVELIKTILNGKDGEHTMIVVTYDEFGGQWDHVPPPTGAGVSDVWGPGTRIPALVISNQLHGTNLVDHTQYDTTSILATIEARFHLPALSTRDAAVNNLSNVFQLGRKDDDHGGDE
jgi:acid phosphatase